MKNFIVVTSEPLKLSNSQLKEMAEHMSEQLELADISEEDQLYINLLMLQSILTKIIDKGELVESMTKTLTLNTLNRIFKNKEEISNETTRVRSSEG